jgi:hypothetical protein
MAKAAIDGPRLEAFMGQAVVDLAAAFSAPLVRLDARLGLYRVLAEGGPATPAELAERTGSEPRMVREWLGNQAAGDYVTYDDAAGAYIIPPEQAIALADEESEFCILGAYDILASFFADEDRLVEAFRSGAGLPWAEHDHRLFAGAEAFSALGTGSTWCQVGFPRSREWSTSSRRGRALRTSAVVTAPRRSSWPRPSPPRRSWASTRTERDRARTPGGGGGWGRRTGAVRDRGRGRAAGRGLRPRLLVRRRHPMGR